MPRIQSLARADAILGEVAEAGAGGIKLHELSSRLGLNKTTVFNLVGTLVSLGYVIQEEGSRAYRLGPRALQLGLNAQRQNSLIQFCGPALEHLCQETNETVNVAIPLRDTAVIIDSREGGHQVRLTSYAGTAAPYHATACGKALFAFFDEARRQAHYERVPMPAIGPRTITDPASLEKDLVTIRETRCALDLEEMERGAHCVAVPLFDPSGAVCASISVAGLRDRLDVPELRRIAGLIQRQATQLERQLRIGS